MKIRAITICESHRLVLLEHWLEFFKERVDELRVIIQTDNLNISVGDASFLCLRYGAKAKRFHWSHNCANEQKYISDLIKSLNPRGWHWCADSDEFPDENLDLHDLAEKCEKTNANHIKARMVDRLAPHGQLTEMLPAPSLFKQYPLQASVTSKLCGGYDIKVPFCKDPYHGHHDFQHPGLTSRYLLRLNHFKWDDTVVERMRKRFRQNVENEDPYLDERRKFLKHYEEHGKINVEDFEVNMENVVDLV